MPQPPPYARLGLMVMVMFMVVMMFVVVLVVLVVMIDGPVFMMLTGLVGHDREPTLPGVRTF